MLSAQDNALITQTSKGTPMGELFRRFWLPVLLPEELPEPDCPPIRIQVMGEYLVAFRDTNAPGGIVEAFCPHRRAPLFYGRNEECGLRCVYHGWKFDVTGQCVDMPSEPADSDFPSKVQIDAYPTREFGGVIWIYMGPPDKVPESLPQLEWALVPSEQRRVTKNFQECNYLQALEGDIDTAHVSYLHSTKKRLPQNQGVVRDVGRIDKAPRLMVLNHDAGFAYGGRRTVPDGGYYWRVTQFLWPTYAFIPAFSWPKTCTYGPRRRPPLFPHELRVQHRGADAQLRHVAAAWRRRRSMVAHVWPVLVRQWPGDSRRAPTRWRSPIQPLASTPQPMPPKAAA